MVDKFVTLDSETGHLDAPVEARIVELAGGVDPGTPGSGTVTAVAGVSPDETGNVPLTAANVGAIATSARGAANGVAPLSNAGKVNPTYLALSPAPGKILSLDADNNSHWVAPTGSARNVLDFLADRTGGSSSTAAFNAAIVASLNDTGGLAASIEVPAGQYLFDAPIDPIVDIPFSLRGAGYRATTLLASKDFHANYPGRYLLHVTGTGTSDGQTQVRAPGYTATATFTEQTAGPFRSGWDSVLGSAGADATILLKTGTLVSTGTLTVSIDQSDDPLFGSGVTTSTVTFNETESNADKSMGNGGVAPNNGSSFWVARYFRIRHTLTGSPTSWPIQITYNNNYNVLTGVDLSGFAVNAAGSPTTSNQSLGMDADGRWNTRGIMIDRSKWVDMRNVWVNKARGQGISLREVWDSYFADLKVLKCGDATALTPAMACEPFNAWVTGSNTNNSTFVQVHLEDNKYTQLYIGRRSRRLRWFGLKCHGDLASNSVMTLAPHIRLESAYTNQFVGFSMNRAGQSHVEMDVHPAEQAQKDAGVALAGGYTTADRNMFSDGYFDSARTNTALAPGGTPSVKIIKGSFNRFGKCTWSSNPKAADVATGNSNIDNAWGEDCEFHDFYDSTARALTGNITNELTGPVRTTWVHPTTGVRSRWDGTTLTTIS